MRRAWIPRAPSKPARRRSRMSSTASPRLRRLGTWCRRSPRHRHGWEPLFTLGASPDFKNSTVMGTTASQGGLGLPNRDYYLRSDSTARALRAAYLEYVSRMLQLSGDAPAVADSLAQRIVALETALARASLTR